MVLDTGSWRVKWSQHGLVPLVFIILCYIVGLSTSNNIFLIIAYVCGVITLIAL